VTAGAGFDAHWKCHRCAYEWVAPVVQRTCRQTRCARCYTERADGKNSLAAVHPELVREWDAATKRAAPARPDQGHLRQGRDLALPGRCEPPDLQDVTLHEGEEADGLSYLPPEATDASRSRNGGRCGLTQRGPLLKGLI